MRPGFDREGDMSWQSCPDPVHSDRHVADAIETVIVPSARDLGGFEVRRALPSRMRQMVGPFIFFDQMGPVEFARELMSARSIGHNSTLSESLRASVSSVSR